MVHHSAQLRGACSPRRLHEHSFEERAALGAPICRIIPFPDTRPAPCNAISKQRPRWSIASLHIHRVTLGAVTEREQPPRRQQVRVKGRSDVLSQEHKNRRRACAAHQTQPEVPGYARPRNSVARPRETSCAEKNSVHAPAALFHPPPGPEMRPSKCIALAQKFGKSRRPRKAVRLADDLFFGPRKNYRSAEHLRPAGRQKLRSYAGRKKQSSTRPLFLNRPRIQSPGTHPCSWRCLPAAPCCKVGQCRLTHRSARAIATVRAECPSARVPMPDIFHSARTPNSAHNSVCPSERQRTGSGPRRRWHAPRRRTWRR